MNPSIELKKITSLLVIVLLLVCFALAQRAQAVSPPPDGAYPNFTTAEGQNALHDLTTGAGNTALGAFSLFSTTTANFNTAVGAGALDLNTGDSNTAVGVVALLLNTGTQNTAVGVDALVLNTAGGSNAAVGAFALGSNTTGFDNTASGAAALAANTTGGGNTAIGFQALPFNTTGSNNIAVGNLAGGGVITANNVICIGTNLSGADVSNTCFIGDIRGTTTQNNDAVPVVIDSAGQLGTASSSRRYKTDVRPIDKASESILALKPVSFRYKAHKDTTRQFGLIAEDVAEVNPDLVVRDKNGEIYTVRYDAVNAMLLNEFLKEHRAFIEEQRKMQQQEKTIAELKSGIEALAATVKEQASQIQKVSAQLELSKPAPQTVVNDQ